MASASDPRRSRGSARAVREIARSFIDVEETRIAADYDEQALQRPEVEAAIQDAESFVKACELMIGNKAP
jgi:hypothetical protein